MTKAKIEFTLRKDGYFQVKNLSDGKLGVFSPDGYPVAGPLCLDIETVTEAMIAFSDISLPGTFVREVEINQ